MVEINGITKAYFLGYILKDVSFKAQEGGSIAILGRKGAGKTVLADILSGCARADSGSVSICGHDMAKRPSEAKRSLGYMPQMPSLYPEMTPEEYLLFVCSLRGLRGKSAKLAVTEAEEKAKAAGISGREIRRISIFDQKRLLLEGALCGSPKVLVIDEPSQGLAPEQGRAMRDAIAALKGEHTIVLLTSSIHEATEVCDSVAVLCGAAITAREDTKDILRAAQRQRRITVKLKSQQRLGLELLRGIKGVERVETQGSESGASDYVVESSGSDLREEIFSACAAAGVPLIGMGCLSVTLDDIYSGLTGGGQ